MSKLPVNRIVAFAGPYIAILSGAVADWLIVHVHLFSLFHTTSSSITKWLTQALVFALTAGLVWAGQQKWLTGWQLFETQVAGEDANGPDVHPDDYPYGEYDPTAVEEGEGMMGYEPVPGGEVPFEDDPGAIEAEPDPTEPFATRRKLPPEI